MTTLCTSCNNLKTKGGMYFCRHEANLRLSLVDGELHTVTTPESCRERAGHCGPEAKHFELRLEVA